MELSHDPAIPFFHVYLKSQNTKMVVIHICCCMIHSSQETESVGMPTNRKIEKENIVYMHKNNGILQENECN